MNIFIQFSTADSPDGMKQKPKKDASFKFYLPKAETQKPTAQWTANIQHDKHSSRRKVAATNNLRADLSSCLNVMDGDQTKPFNRWLRESETSAHIGNGISMTTCWIWLNVSSCYVWPWCVVSPNKQSTISTHRL